MKYDKIYSENSILIAFILNIFLLTTTACSKLTSKYQFDKSLISKSSNIQYKTRCSKPLQDKRLCQLVRLIEQILSSKKKYLADNKNITSLCQKIIWEHNLSSALVKNLFARLISISHERNNRAYLYIAYMMLREAVINRKEIVNGLLQAIYQEANNNRNEYKKFKNFLFRRTCNDEKIGNIDGLLWQVTYHWEPEILKSFCSHISRYWPKECLKALLSRNKAHSGDTLLHEAIKHGGNNQTKALYLISLFKELLSKIDSEEDLKKLVNKSLHNELDAKKQLLDAIEKDKLLEWIAKKPYISKWQNSINLKKNDKTSLLKWLLMDLFINRPNNRQNTPIHIMAKHPLNACEVLSYTLKNFPINLNAQNNDGSTFIHMAVESSYNLNDALIECLVQHGSINPNLVDKNGNTVLNDMIKFKCSPLSIKKILERRPNLNLVDDCAKSPLHNSIESGNATTFDEVLYGVESYKHSNSILILLNQTDQDGNNPLNLAIHKGNWYMTKQLKMIMDKHLELSQIKQIINELNVDSVTPMEALRNSTEAEAATILKEFMNLLASKTDSKRSIDKDRETISVPYKRSKRYCDYGSTTKELGLCLEYDTIYTISNYSLCASNPSEHTTG